MLFRAVTWKHAWPWCEQWQLLCNTCPAGELKHVAHRYVCPVEQLRLPLLLCLRPIIIIIIKGGQQFCSLVHKNICSFPTDLSDEVTHVCLLWVAEHLLGEKQTCQKLNQDKQSRSYVWPAAQVRAGNRCGATMSAMCMWTHQQPEKQILCFSIKRFNPCCSLSFRPENHVSCYSNNKKRLHRVGELTNVVNGEAVNIWVGRSRGREEQTAGAAIFRKPHLHEQ